MDITFLIPLIVAASGTYFLVKLRAFFIVRPLFTAKRAVAAFSDGASFSSLMLALAGTLGVGNIFGVATAIIIGGAGSVFWLLVSAFFSAVIKYAEVAVASDKGGIPTAIKLA